MKKRPYKAALAALLLLAAGGLAFYWRRPAAPQPMTGEAQAVAVTPCVVYDGIWDATHYSSEFYYPVGIALTDERALVVADTFSDRLQLAADGQYTRVGRPGQNGLAYLDSGGLQDGPWDDALFKKPTDVAIGSDGRIYICDTGNHVVRVMDDAQVATLAGSGTSGYADGRGGEARFNAPRGVAVDSAGNVYIADTMNHVIRRVDPDGSVTLVAGTPSAPGYQDGAAGQSRFFEPSGLCWAADGSLYVADAANHAIRRIRDGQVSTVAGRPGAMDPATEYPAGGYADGPNGEALFFFPRDVALMPDGTLAVADSMNHAVRHITRDETRTLAGGGRPGKYYGAAENIALSRPESVAADAEHLYISDSLNNRVVAIPLTPRALAGRPSRAAMLASTGIITDSRYAYKGEIRVYLNGAPIDMGRVKPWNTTERIYMPLRALFEALGAVMTLDEASGLVTITIQGKDTALTLDRDYFILKGVAVTTLDELIRLFPYTLEWFEEFSLIALYVPPDLQGGYADGEE